MRPGKWQPLRASVRSEGEEDVCEVPGVAGLCVTRDMEQTGRRPQEGGLVSQRCETRGEVVGGPCHLLCFPGRPGSVEPADWPGGCWVGSTECCSLPCAVQGLPLTLRLCPPTTLCRW